MVSCSRVLASGFKPTRRIGGNKAQGPIRARFNVGGKTGMAYGHSGTTRQHTIHPDTSSPWLGNKMNAMLIYIGGNHKTLQIP